MTELQKKEIKTKKSGVGMPVKDSKRLFSLDFFRGLTMFFLIGTSTRLYGLMEDSDIGIISAIGWQFEHRYWHGITLWDFVEPFFMFIVGVAIPFSVLHRLEKGSSWNEIIRHALQRSAAIVYIGHH